MRGVHARGECFARIERGVALTDFQALDPARCELASITGAGRGGLRRARIGAQDAFVREYRRGGMLAGVLPAWRASARRLLDELALSAELERRGIATPLALGGWALRRGAGSELYLATAVVAGAEDLVVALERGALARATPRARRRCARELGAFVRRLHESGLVHPDLQPRNLLVRVDGDRPSFWVLDLDRARLAAALDTGARVAQLSRLWRWWIKRPAESARLARSDVAAFWLGYAARAGRRAALSAAQAHSRRSLAWHRLGWRSGSSSAPT